MSELFKESEEREKEEDNLILYSCSLCFNGVLHFVNLTFTVGVLVQDSGDHLTLATRWFDGFIKKDIQISNEVYSVNSVEFDRQELRRLVRNVHYIQDRCKGDDQDPGETAAAAATNSLRCFLISLAKRLSISSNLAL